MAVQVLDKFLFISFLQSIVDIAFVFLLLIFFNNLMQSA